MRVALLCLAVTIAGACAQVPDELDVVDGAVRTSSPLAEMTGGSSAVEYERLVELVGPRGARWCGLIEGGAPGGWYPNLTGIRRRGRVDANRTVTVVLPNRDPRGNALQSMGYQCFVVDPETRPRQLVTRYVQGVGSHQTLQPIMVHVGGRDPDSEARWAALRERVLAHCPRSEGYNALIARLPCPANEPLWNEMMARDLEDQ